MFKYYYLEKNIPTPKRIVTDANNIVSDEELEKFLGINGIKNRDENLIRDILVISRIYDRNFDRLMAEENELKKHNYKIVEDSLNKASSFMRSLALISSGEGGKK